VGRDQVLLVPQGNPGVAHLLTPLNIGELAVHHRGPDDVPQHQGGGVVLVDEQNLVDDL